MPEQTKIAKDLKLKKKILIDIFNAKNPTFYSDLWLLFTIDKVRKLLKIEIELLVFEKYDNRWIILNSWLKQEKQKYYDTKLYWI